MPLKGLLMPQYHTYQSNGKGTPGGGDMILPLPEVQGLDCIE